MYFLLSCNFELFSVLLMNPCHIKTSLFRPLETYLSREQLFQLGCKLQKSIGSTSNNNNYINELVLHAVRCRNSLHKQNLLKLIEKKYFAAIMHKNNHLLKKSRPIIFLVNQVNRTGDFLFLKLEQKLFKSNDSVRFSILG